MSEPTNDVCRRERVLACVAATLLLATLVTFHIVSGTFAKYSTAASSSDVARVTLFGHDESIDLSNWVANLKPGDSCDIRLEVSNSDASEVAQAYDIEVETAGNLPLAYTLARDDEVGSFSEVSSAVYTFASDDMVFAPGNPDVHTYMLTVNWPADENAAKYSAVPDYVQVRINVRQID